MPDPLEPTATTVLLEGSDQLGQAVEIQSRLRSINERLDQLSLLWERAQERQRSVRDVPLLDRPVSVSTESSRRSESPAPIATLPIALSAGPVGASLELSGPKQSIAAVHACKMSYSLLVMELFLPLGGKLNGRSLAGRRSSIGWALRSLGPASQRRGKNGTRRRE